MSKNKLFLICMAVVMMLACSVMAAAAVPEFQWDGYYCTSGTCGINLLNYSCGWNNSYCCSPSYVAPFQAEFIRDVTYPDGTYVMPGSTFTKTWRLRNVGTQGWTTGTKLVYIAGDSMSGVSTSIPYYVAPGNSVDVSVNLTAPTYGGTLYGQWMLQSPDGTLFGVGCNGQTPIWVSVKTWTNGACSCLGQPVCNCTAPSYKSGRNPYCNNKIRSIRDITIPDGTVVAPGATFRKTWSMKNGGTCVWDENYIVSFFYGDDLGFDGQVSIVPAGWDDAATSGVKYSGINRPKKIYVHPGETVYVSIDLTAPTTPGMYESYFKLRDNLGYEFGFGSYADSAFWVNIIVDDGAKGVDADAGETGTIAKDVDPALVDVSQPVSEGSGVEVVDAVVMGESGTNACGEQSIALRSTASGYDVLWTAVNAGTQTWENYNLVMADANPAISLTNDKVVVPTTAPGEKAEVSFGVNIDSAAANGDPLWLEFYMDSGSEGFCEFYFEAPAK